MKRIRAWLKRLRDRKADAVARSELADHLRKVWSLLSDE